MPPTEIIQIDFTMFCDGTRPAQRPQLKAPAFMFTLSPSRNASERQVTINYGRSSLAHQSSTAEDSDTTVTSLTVTTAQGVQVAVQTPEPVEEKAEWIPSAAAAGSSTLDNPDSTLLKAISSMNYEPSVVMTAPLEDHSESPRPRKKLVRRAPADWTGPGRSRFNESASSSGESTGPTANTEISMASTLGLKEEGSRDDAMAISNL